MIYINMYLYRKFIGAALSQFILLAFKAFLENEQYLFFKTILSRVKFLLVETQSINAVLMV